jgi:hypothetical protein
MQLTDRVGPAWRLGILPVVLSLWLGLSALLAVTRGKPEDFLVKTFGGFSRDDAFEHLNGVSILFWLFHSLLVLIALAATWYRRTDVLTVLMIGPIIASAIVLLVTSWADPNWFEIVAVISIGWLASVVVALGYWIVEPLGAGPPAAPISPANRPKTSHK